jgi:hypothetical protein
MIRGAKDGFRGQVVAVVFLFGSNREEEAKMFA